MKEFYKICDAKDRFSQALGEHYDKREPYVSLSRVVMAEYEAFNLSRKNLSRKIDATEDTQIRKIFELCMHIECAEYMVITSKRIADQSVLIAGKITEEAIESRKVAEFYLADSKMLREELQDIYEEIDCHNCGSGIHVLPTNEKESLELLGLVWPVDFTKIKSRYRRLVKLHHPDVNKGCSKSNERIKLINRAFNILSNIYKQS